MSNENDSLLAAKVGESDLANGVVAGEVAHRCSDHGGKDGDCLGDREPQTILNECNEAEIMAKDPKLYKFLTSLKGVMIQNGLCVIMILMNAYDPITKGKANDNGQVQQNVIQFCNIVFPIILGVVLCFVNGTTDLLFNKDFFKILGNFAIPGCLFAVSQSLAFVTQCNIFFPPDVGKVIDQARLLLTAIITVAIFGKSRMPSRATWAALVTITFAVTVYTLTAQMTSKIAKLEAGKGSSAGTGENEYNYFVGTLLCLVNALIMVTAGLVAEKLLKQYKHIPFYIQKIYLELPGFIFVPFYTAYIQEFIFVIVNAQEEAKKLATHGKGFLELLTPDFSGFASDAAKDGRFNTWLYFYLILFIMKSYLAGILVKQMSSIVKQICQVSGTALCYFLKCMHNGQPITVEMVLADLLVFSSVMGYIFSNVDKKRKTELKKERDDAQALNSKFAAAA